MTREDAISREAARKALQNEIDKIKPPFNGQLEETLGAIRAGVRLSRNIIEDLPSVTPKPTGHWITSDYFIFKCSECECEVRWDSDYCPNCGARMEDE